MRLAVVVGVSFCAACATVRAQDRDDSTRLEPDEPAPPPEVIEGDAWAPYPEPSETPPGPGFWHVFEWQDGFNENFVEIRCGEPPDAGE